MTTTLAVLQRLSEILRLEEFESKRSLNVDRTKPAVKIENGKYAWGFRISDNQKQNMRVSHSKVEVENTDTPVLRNINLNLASNDLLVVVGKIGSGKTSLLYSIMDETCKKEGTHEV